MVLNCETCLMLWQLCRLCKMCAGVVSAADKRA